MTEKITTKLSDKDRSDEVDIGRLIGTIFDNKWLIIGITICFGLVGLLYSILATPVYRADALIQVERSGSNSLLSDLSQVLPTFQPQSAAEIELIKSRMVLGKTVKDLALNTIVEESKIPLIGKGLARVLGDEPSNIAISRLDVPQQWVDKEFKLTVLSANTYEIEAPNGNKYIAAVGKIESHDGIILLVSDIKAPSGTSFLITKQSDVFTINQLLEKLSINDKGKDSGVLQISLEGTDPELTKKTLNSISLNYLQQNVERKSEEAGKSLDFLKAQLPQIRESLDDAENKLNRFRQENESVDLTLEAKSVLDTMVAVESQINELTFKESEISKLYTKEHPAYRALLEKRVTLEQEKEKLNKRVSSMPKTQQEILRLTRDVQAGQEIYMQLLNKQQELNINKASTVGNVRIIDLAVTQPHPVKPGKRFIIAFSIILGAIFSVAIVLVTAWFRKGIENPEQLEELGYNVYASIPLSEWQQRKDRELLQKSKNKKGNTRADELLAIGNPADLAIEAIRSLRTSLHFAMLEAKNNILMISGASPAIGKTFVSANLAAVIAQSGKRVLLVDCDMRKGYAHELMGTDGHNGLSDILSRQLTTEGAIRKTMVANMDFIPRGQIPPNPSELLMHQSFIEFTNWAQKNYDIVLLDTPPILAVTDAAIIGHHVGTALLVARFEENTLKEIEVSIRRFEQNNTEVKGVILNAVVKRAASYYGYGNYNYYTYEYKSEK